METITKEYKVYNFKELKPEVKDRVLDKLRNQEMNSDFWYETELDCISEDLKEEYGIEVKPSNLYFDIYKGWLAMGKEADIIDVQKFIKKVVDNKVLLAQTISNPDWNIKNIDLNIGTERNEESNNISVICNGYNYEDGDDRWEEEKCKKILEEELQIDLDGCIDKLNDDLLKRIREQQDYVCGKEYLKGEIEARELKFLEDGSIF